MKEVRLIIGDKVYLPWTPTGPNAEAIFGKAAISQSKFLG